MWFLYAGTLAVMVQSLTLGQRMPGRVSRTPEEVEALIRKVGGKAPDFEATAYVDGDFKNVKLSDYAGKWVTLCFYPGDFTFV